MRAWIHVGLRGEILGRFDLVYSLVFAKLQVGHLFEFLPACTGAAVIHGSDDVAFLCQHLVPCKIAGAVGVEHGLRARAAVYGHEHRVFLVRVEIGRQDLPAMQFHAFRSGEGEEFLLAEVVFG